ncbi:MAG TPA: NYN domain-containing protein [Nevskia sp.]|nr:NYN domain-containing protein [Nevskia sp.]
MDKEEQSRLAVLIDADNSAPDIAEGLLREAAKYGVASVKRAYGDWTTDNLKGWKKVLLEHSIQPIQQFSYTRGKNATDSAMIIDAMDLLYTGRFDGFCIVSSDSDFTRLASRIREQGLTVYGFGERKTPEPFVAACDRFIYTDVLRGGGEEEEEDSTAVKRLNTSQLKAQAKLVAALRAAVEARSDESGWAHLGAVGQHVAKQSPEFDSRNYGYRKLRDLVTAMQLFELEERPQKDGRGKDVYVRDKRRKNAKGD